MSLVHAEQCTTEWHAALPHLLSRCLWTKFRGRVYTLFHWNKHSSLINYGNDSICNPCQIYRSLILTKRQLPLMIHCWNLPWKTEIFSYKKIMDFFGSNFPLWTKKWAIYFAQWTLTKKLCVKYLQKFWPWTIFALSWEAISQKPFSFCQVTYSFLFYLKNSKLSMNTHLFLRNGEFTTLTWITLLLID